MNKAAILAAYDDDQAEILAAYVNVALRADEVIEFIKRKYGVTSEDGFTCMYILRLSQALDRLKATTGGLNDGQADEDVYSSEE